MKRALLPWLLTGIWTVLASAPSQAGDRGVPASNGITNFGKVNDHLYRGAQPNAAAIANLKKLGVKTIICLRLPNDLWTPEKTETTNHGIAFINIPLKGVERPKELDVERALAVIDDSPGPVFVHCQFGCDRTGTIIACYRIQHDHWSDAQAESEADHYGMSTLEWRMRSFIADFAKRTAKQQRDAHIGGAAKNPSP